MFKKFFCYKRDICMSSMNKNMNLDAMPSNEEILKIDDLENQVKDLMESIQKQSISQNQFQMAMLNIQQQLNLMKTKFDTEKQKQLGTLDQMKRILELLKTTITPKYKSLEEIPGIRIPRWYDVILDFSTSTGSDVVVNTTQTMSISPDGPFIVTQITPILQLPTKLDGNFVSTSKVVPERGRIIPTTTYMQFCNNLGKTNTGGAGYNTPSASQLTYQFSTIPSTTEWGVLGDIPEFDVLIKVEGNGRLWTNRPLTTAGLFGTKGYPLFTGVQGIFERSDRISINARLKTPFYAGVVDNPRARKLRICFHGYQILNPITICDLIGY